MDLSHEVVLADSDLRWERLNPLSNQENRGNRGRVNSRGKAPRKLLLRESYAGQSVTKKHDRNTISSFYYPQKR